ncbi:hypothetical protein PVAP13_9KG095423 [Panicum virgatum]|uniref:GOLD domain-containing protein n=1 Tax=Panicum virgatum TaxID=38727 RepID=A0A8T0NW43_PANVG|nr:hypothetical protein PVAP13_9KG095423 [Panicum virgatum]
MVAVDYTALILNPSQIRSNPPSPYCKSIAEELKKLEDSARLIQEEMISLRQSEREMQRLNEDTGTRIHSFTLVSLAMCVGVAGLQLRQLKTFFQKQHIL